MKSIADIRRENLLTESATANNSNRFEKAVHFGRLFYFSNDFFDLNQNSLTSIKRLNLVCLQYLNKYGLIVFNKFNQFLIIL